MIVYSYVPALSYLISSNKILPSSSFFLVSFTFPSPFRVKLNSSAFNGRPLNSFFASSCTLPGMALYVFLKTGISSSLTFSYTTSASSFPAFSVTVTVTLYCVLSYVTPSSGVLGVASVIVYSYVPALAYLISSNKILPSSSFFLVSFTFPSPFRVKLNSSAFKGRPLNSFFASSCTLPGKIWR